MTLLQCRLSGEVSTLMSFGCVYFKRCKRETKIRTSLSEEHLLQTQPSHAPFFNPERSYPHGHGYEKEPLLISQFDPNLNFMIPYPTFSTSCELGVFRS